MCGSFYCFIKDSYTKCCNTMESLNNVLRLMDACFVLGHNCHFKSGINRQFMSFDVSIFRLSCIIHFMFQNVCLNASDAAVGERD